MLKSIMAVAALAAPVVWAQGPVSCGGGQLCPESAPCCSAYGACGVGAYCLGGCDPLNSFSLDSCVPAPVCKDTTDSFDSLSSIVAQENYLGDATKANWVSQGEPLSFNGNVLLTMAQGTVGTLMASTHYVWYGTINARFSTSAGQGVVTAFILMSDVKDEIDFEFVGKDLNTVQTNYYNQGVTNYNNGLFIPDVSDTHTNYHDYTIDWQPDQLTWSIDGNVVRTVKKSETWNATANRYSYPQTPARVMLSLWPAGLESNGEGTVEWAGGLVDWNSQYMNKGYYFAQFDSVSVKCAPTPSGANVQGSTSYIYTDKRATNDTVEMTNKPTVLKSLLGSGLNMDADVPSAAPSSSASASAEVAMIPGLTGAGTGANGQRGGDGASTNSATNNNNNGGGDNANSDGANTNSNTGGTDSFDQGLPSGSGSSGSTSNAPGSESASQGSMFAVIIAIIGLCML